MLAGTASPVRAESRKDDTFSANCAAGEKGKHVLWSQGGHLVANARSYGHLMPGNEDEAAALLDTYLERANTRSRLAALAIR